MQTKMSDVSLSELKTLSCSFFQGSLLGSIRKHLSNDGKLRSPIAKAKMFESHFLRSMNVVQTIYRSR